MGKCPERIFRRDPTEPASVDYSCDRGPTANESTGEYDGENTTLLSRMSPARPLRIFLVENHADTLKWLTLYLQQMGHTVIAARSMEEALSGLPSAECEVLISDIGLPDGDGWQLLRKLRDTSVPPPRYAIAMSGYGMNADRSKSKAAGYNQHLLKPFGANDLQAALERGHRRTWQLDHRLCEQKCDALQQ